MMKINYKVAIFIILINLCLYSLNGTNIEIPEFISIILIFLIAPVYILGLVGVDFLLENNGNCGGGICGISYVGYLTINVLYYLLGVKIAKLINKKNN